MRGRQRLGATLIKVLDNYADELERVGGHLFLAGVNMDTAAQLKRAGKLNFDRTITLVPAVEAVGAATDEARTLAHAWLSRARDSGAHKD